MAQTTSRTPLGLEASNSVVIPASGNTVLLDLPVLGLTRLGVELVVTVNNLDGLLVEVKFHPSSTYVTLTNAVTATPAGLVIAASGTLASLAVGTGWFILDTRGIYSVRVSASGSVDDATAVTARATGG